MSIVSCRVTQQVVYSIFDSKRARHSSAWPLNGCVAPRLVAKIRSALPYLAQLAKGGSRPTAALEKSMIDTTTAMPQVGDSGLQGDVFHTFHKKQPAFCDMTRVTRGNIGCLTAGKLLYDTKSC